MIKSYFRCDSEVNLTPEERKELLAIQVLGDGQGYSGKPDFGASAQNAKTECSLFTLIKRINLLGLSSWCLVIVALLILTVP